MPGFDQTGPAGRGPGTGGGYGWCGNARRRPGRLAGRPLSAFSYALRGGLGLRRGGRSSGNGGGPQQT